MDIVKIKAFNRERNDIQRKGWDELPEVMDGYWERLSDFIASDIPGAVDFLCNSADCNVEIFLDWSEVFEDVVRKSQSREFIDAIRTVYNRFATSCRGYEIPWIIDYAASELNS